MWFLAPPVILPILAGLGIGWGVGHSSSPAPQTSTLTGATNAILLAGVVYLGYRVVIKK
jgi:hypothetical protein